MKSPSSYKQTNEQKTNHSYIRPSIKLLERMEFSHWLQIRISHLLNCGQSFRYQQNVITLQDGVLCGQSTTHIKSSAITC